MLDKSIILILDPRGIISNGGIDVLLRHQEYQDNLEILSSSTAALVIITRKLSFPIPASSSLEVHQASSPFGWLQISRKWIGTNASRVRWVVAGEPWITFWICFVSKSLFLRKSKLQLQVHGDFGNPVWREKSFFKKIRYSSLKFALRLSDAVRAVGFRQANFLAQVLRESKEKIFVSAMNYSIGSFRRREIAVPLTLGFVGRLESDRGVDIFAKFVSCLGINDETFKVLVIGDGRKKKWLQRKLSILGDRVRFVGQVGQEQVDSLLSEVSVLCSFAPVESFGRSAREALSRGVPVIGIKSSGLADLKDVMETESGLTLLEEKFSSDECVGAVKSAVQLGVDRKVHELLQKSSALSCKRLIESWL